VEQAARLPVGQSPRPCLVSDQAAVLPDGICLVGRDQTREPGGGRRHRPTRSRTALIYLQGPLSARTSFLILRSFVMPKIALIGAGSTVFAKNLIGDILSFPELRESHIALMDIDPERLRTSE